MVINMSILLNDEVSKPFDIAVECIKAEFLNEAIELHLSKEHHILTESASNLFEPVHFGCRGGGGVYLYIYLYLFLYLFLFL